MDVTRKGDIDVIFVEEVLHRSLHIKANQLVMFARVGVVPNFSVKIECDGWLESPLNTRKNKLWEHMF